MDIDESVDAKQRVPTAHLRIAVSNGRILTILGFLQGALAGWALSQTERPVFAGGLIVGAILIVVFLLRMYVRSMGMLDEVFPGRGRRWDDIFTSDATQIGAAAVSSTASSTSP